MNRTENKPHFVAVAEEAIQSPETLKTTLDALGADKDAALREYIQAAERYLESYAEDVNSAAEALADTRAKAKEAAARRDELKKSLAAATMGGDPEALEALETEIADAEASLAQLNARAESLAAYEPTGSASLLSIAERNEKSWRAASGRAGQTVEEIEAALAKKSAEIEGMKKTARGGIPSSVKIPAGRHLRELKEKHAGGVSLETAKEREREAQAAAAARAEALRIQAERLERMDQRGKRPKPEKKTVTGPDGVRTYALNHETGEYDLVKFDKE